MSEHRMRCDVLVLGSGIAGLSFALEAARFADVIIATKRSADEANTKYAQGGIAAVLSPEDSVELHVKDTLIAGAGLCREDAVRAIIEDGPARIRDLQQVGVHFDQRHDEHGVEIALGEPGEFGGGRELDLGREGGHSKRRVCHAGDITGRAVEAALLDACRKHPRIRILEDHMGVDLIVPPRFSGEERCLGAYVLDTRTSDGATKVLTITAHVTVLATGGAGKVYLYTSNPDVATGDGVAMAYRAGAKLANMEFFQFHPTVLWHPQAKSFLISEALRGEGAVLKLPDGTPFMKKFDERADLAPRDIVARSIDHEMKRTGSEYVLLDISHQRSDFIKARFPNIYAECLQFGFDLTTQPIPVVPAAHYMCGGVVASVDGRTSIPGLHAIGEVACTGLHGANRLASNSLLEGVVMGHRCARQLEAVFADRNALPSIPEVRSWDPGSAVASDEAVVVTQNWDELRRAMWNYVGIVRTDRRLQRAATRIKVLQEEIKEYYWAHLVNRDLLELRNISTVASVIVTCAQSRKESRGLHYTLDYPKPDPAFAKDTVMRRGGSPKLSRD